MEPKGPNMEPTRAQIEPKGPNIDQKGAERGPKNIEIINLELSPPPQEDLAAELARGSYRSRRLKGLCLGGSWRYIAGGFAEEEEGGGRRRRRRKDGRTVEI